MKSKTQERSPRRHHTVILEQGDEVMAGLNRFVREQNIRGAHFTALGAFRETKLAFFDWESKDYLDLPLDEQSEVVVLAGDISWKEDEPIIHAHAVLGRRDGSTLGGHLQSGIVRPTLELFIEEGPELERSFDPRSGLSLVDPEAEA